MGGPANNLLIADTEGDVRYPFRGRLPLRDPRNGSAVPGWEQAHWWSGWVPFEAMPTGRPKDRVFVTANTRPFAGTAPYVGHDFAGPWRARRVLQLLSEHQVIDRAVVERIHGDVVSLGALALVDRIQGLQCSDPQAEELRQLLARWNGSMDPDSIAATLYTVARRELVDAIARDIGLPDVVRALDYELPAARLLDSALPSLMEVGSFEEERTDHSSQHCCVPPSGLPAQLDKSVAPGPGEPCIPQSSHTPFVGGRWSHLRWPSPLTTKRCG